MVSPYLLKPLRGLQEVLDEAVPLPPHVALRPILSGPVAGTAAALLRRQGRISKPRVVWINETAPREFKLRGKPRKKD